MGLSPAKPADESIRTHRCLANLRGFGTRRKLDVRLVEPGSRLDVLDRRCVGGAGLRNRANAAQMSALQAITGRGARDRV
jgi:hypothetical protein